MTERARAEVQQDGRQWEYEDREQADDAERQADIGAGEHGFDAGVPGAQHEAAMPAGGGTATPDWA